MTQQRPSTQGCHAGRPHAAGVQARRRAGDVREPQLLARLLLPGRGPQAVGRGGHRLRPRRPRVAGAAGRAPRPPDDALAGFCVAEDAVAEQLTPFVDAASRETLASQESLMAWVFTLQRRDEAAPRAVLRSHRGRGTRAAGRRPPPSAAQRPASTPRRRSSSSSRSSCPRWPRSSRRVKRAGRGRQPLPHAARGGRLQRRANALLDDLADGALPGVREGVERVERDERWHVGFGLRCLIETQPSQERSMTSSRGPARPPRPGATPSPPPSASTAHARCAHRLHVAGFIETRAAA